MLDEFHKMLKCSSKKKMLKCHLIKFYLKYANCCIFFCTKNTALEMFYNYKLYIRTPTCTYSTQHYMILLTIYISNSEYKFIIFNVKYQIQ